MSKNKLDDFITADNLNIIDLCQISTMVQRRKHGAAFLPYVYA